MTRPARLDDATVEFPDPRSALREPNGLLAIGGDLQVDRLLRAYRQGIFPWYEDGEPVLWWSPDPRCVVDPARFKPSRSLARTLRKERYEIRIDTAFRDVINACRQRDDGSGTWITGEMLAAYLRLFERGHAHSVECFMDGQLAGGLYGVCVGNLFFGESMFHRVTDASKIAFAHLMGMMRSVGSPLVDCQVPNPHLASLGAVEIPRESFLRVVAGQVDRPPVDWPRLKASLAQDPRQFI